jgi:hypothetical protein
MRRAAVLGGSGVSGACQRYWSSARCRIIGSAPPGLRLGAAAGADATRRARVGFA